MNAILFEILSKSKRIKGSKACYLLGQERKKTAAILVADIYFFPPEIKKILLFLKIHKRYFVFNTYFKPFLRHSCDFFFCFSLVVSTSTSSSIQHKSEIMLSSNPSDLSLESF